ncbi:hypothetical protein PoB_001338000 [Plakobranchus ocellatus]|uniref:Uncharacterized protein n=1 Tax=Plakobranchus ocellatus TaxID=259542 RepID=A0AAV3YWM3_9GAST|nr:hypothetical protein PoB_001338000 [Plakobranchus ocellatus]
MTEDNELETRFKRNKFTVRFVKIEDNVDVHFCKMWSLFCSRPTYLKEESNGSWVTSFETDNSYAHPTLIFSTVKGNSGHKMAIGLNNLEYHPLAHFFKHGDFPHIFTIPADEVVLRPGEDIVVSVRWSNQQIGSSGETFPSYIFYDFDEKKITAELDDFSINSKGDSLIETHRLYDYGRVYGLDIIIKSLPHHIGGYLLLQSALMAGEFFAFDTPIFLIWFKTALPLRCVNESELFPEGFIHIWVDSRSEDGCIYGESCSMWCRAVGSNVTRMEVKLIWPNETATDVETHITPQEVNIPGVIMTVEWIFHFKEDMSDADGDLNFQCWAFDDSAKSKATQEYKVKLIR